MANEPLGLQRMNRMHDPSAILMGIARFFLLTSALIKKIRKFFYYVQLKCGVSGKGLATAVATAVIVATVGVRSRLMRKGVSR